MNFEASHATGKPAYMPCHITNNAKAAPPLSTNSAT